MDRVWTNIEDSKRPIAQRYPPSDSAGKWFEQPTVKQTDLASPFPGPTSALLTSLCLPTLVIRDALVLDPDH